MSSITVPQPKARAEATERDMWPAGRVIAGQGSTPADLPAARRRTPYLPARAVAAFTLGLCDSAR